MSFMNVFLRRFCVEYAVCRCFPLKNRPFAVILCVKWLTKWRKLGV